MDLRKTSHRKGDESKKVAVPRAAVITGHLNTSTPVWFLIPRRLNRESGQWAWLFHWGETEPIFSTTTNMEKCLFYLYFVTQVNRTWCPWNKSMNLPTMGKTSTMWPCRRKGVWWLWSSPPLWGDTRRNLLLFLHQCLTPSLSWRANISEENKGES